jgi:hypothetical protein
MACELGYLNPSTTCHGSGRAARSRRPPPEACGNVRPLGVLLRLRRVSCDRRQMGAEPGWWLSRARLRPAGAGPGPTPHARPGVAGRALQRREASAPLTTGGLLRFGPCPGLERLNGLGMGWTSC